MAITVFSLIIGLFVLFLLVKELFDLKLCAMCLSVGVTWVVFVLLYWFSNITLPVIVIVLMGETAVGLFYLIRKNVEPNSSFHFFQFPILLTITVVIYSLIEPEDLFTLSVLLASLWVIFSLIYIFKEKSSFLSQSVKKIIACCKDW